MANCGRNELERKYRARRIEKSQAVIQTAVLYQMMSRAAHQQHWVLYLSGLKYPIAGRPERKIPVVLQIVRKFHNPGH
jgi:hypothetical protein